MKIIVVGCGKIGSTLVQQLNEEDHDIVVIDEKEDRVKAITDELDAMGIVGNGVSYQTLSDAGVRNADLLIAVTGSDEENLLCCVVAKRTGHCKTIARVRNPIYTNEISFLRNELGISMIINPDLIAASDIARVLQFPSAMKVDNFARGRVELIHFKVTEDCLLKDMELINIRKKLDCEVLISIVMRGEELTIPRGDFVFHAGDVAAVLSTPAAAVDFFKKVGIETGRVRTAMIAGGGNISYYLARRLIATGISVKIVERDEKRCEELNELLPKALIINADATDEKILKQEGLSAVEGFVALTGVDEENILLSLFAGKFSGAKTVTKINRINYNNVTSEISLDAVTFPSLLSADVITKYARSMNATLESNMENLYKLEDGRVEAMEFLINEASKVTDTPLMNLKLKPSLLIGAIIRNGKAILPGGQDEILVGDSVVVITTHKKLNDIKEILEA
ncbi:MAG: Trk system potassium transporter TrkA [Lachnospiraceae bacterium]|nr:Trk system potassium transporter TrkA [Lachnospiraceae bacterium]